MPVIFEKLDPVPVLRREPVEYDLLDFADPVVVASLLRRDKLPLGVQLRLVAALTAGERGRANEWMPAALLWSGALTKPEALEEFTRVLVTSLLNHECAPGLAQRLLTLPTRTNWLSAQLIAGAMRTQNHMQVQWRDAFRLSGPVGAVGAAMMGLGQRAGQMGVQLPVTLCETLTCLDTATDLAQAATTFASLLPEWNDTLPRLAQLCAGGLSDD